MPNELPNPAKYHRLFRVIFPDLLAFLPQLFRHGSHLRLKVGIIHPSLVELLPSLLQLLPICPFGDLPEGVFGSASSQSQAWPLS